MEKLKYERYDALFMMFLFDYAHDFCIYMLLMLFKCHLRRLSHTNSFILSFSKLMNNIYAFPFKLRRFLSDLPQIVISGSELLSEYDKNVIHYMSCYKLLVKGTFRVKT